MVSPGAESGLSATRRRRGDVAGWSNYPGPMDYPDPSEDPAYDEENGEVPPGWSDQEVTVLPVGIYDSRGNTADGYSMEPPF
jgi:hypothetical protein